MKHKIVIHSLSRFYPYIGGVENHVYYLSKTLNHIGYHIKIVCSNEGCINQRPLSNINISRLNYLFKIANTNITLQLPFKLLAEEFDIMHAHLPTPWSADIGILIAKIRKKRSILTIHADLGKQNFYSNIIIQLYLNTLFKITLYLADTIIIVNKDWEKTFTKTAHLIKKFKNKIRIIPNGVDTTIFKPDYKRINKFSLLFVSLLDVDHRIKGLDYILDAMSVLIRKNKNITLTVIGDGVLKHEYISKSKELGLENHVYFLGELSQEELSSEYKKHSVLLLPSYATEAFGIVAIEAMASGLLVITTNLCGVASEIESSKIGVIVRPKNTSDIVEAVFLLLSKLDNNDTIRSKARDNIIKKYSWDIVAEQYKNIYIP